MAPGCLSTQDATGSLSEAYGSSSILEGSAKHFAILSRERPRVTERVLVLGERVSDGRRKASLGVYVGHERSRALAAFEDPLVLEFLEGGLHCDGGDLVLLSQLVRGGDLVAGLVSAMGNGVTKVVGDHHERRSHVLRVLLHKGNRTSVRQ